MLDNEFDTVLVDDGDEIMETTSLVPRWPMKLPMDRHPVAVYMASLSNGSRPTKMGALKNAARVLTGGMLGAFELDWSKVKYQHVTAVRVALLETQAPETVNKTLSAIRSVLKDAWRLELMSADDMARACDVNRVKYERLPSGRHIRASELKALLETCGADRTISGIRDSAIISVLYATGMRRSELCHLRIRDYTKLNGEIKILNGKGNKDRIVYVRGSAARTLDDWLAVREAEDDEAPIFVWIRKGNHLTKKIAGTEETDGTKIQEIIDKRAEKAGIAKVTPHDFRRTFISDMLDIGIDIVTVQKLAGHSNVNQTAKYDRRGERTKMEAADKLYLPYIERVPYDVK